LSGAKKGDFQRQGAKPQWRKGKQGLGKPVKHPEPGTRDMKSEKRSSKAGENKNHHALRRDLNPEHETRNPQPKTRHRRLDFPGFSLRLCDFAFNSLFLE
jgi:hypothetical protein